MSFLFYCCLLENYPSQGFSVWDQHELISKPLVSIAKLLLGSNVCLHLCVFAMHCKFTLVVVLVTFLLGFTTAVDMHWYQQSTACETRLTQQTKTRPSPEGKMLCCDFYEKMMGSKKGFESKYQSHSSAQRLSRRLLMFYLTGCFDKCVVPGRDDLLYNLLENAVVFRWTSRESQWNCCVWAEFKPVLFFLLTLSYSSDATYKQCSINTCLQTLKSVILLGFSL